MTFMQEYMQKLGCLDLGRLEALPDFLVIAPAKTGTTWLWQVLRRHPQVFIPRIREVRYFCTYWQFLDIAWYMRQFCNEPGIINGELSPTYALLPTSTISIIRKLLPDVKLIFLMRNPVTRSWSHTRHMYKHREGNFQGETAPIHDVPFEKFVENFHHLWNYASSDYLGTLQRWLSVFPKEQFFVAFYEQVIHNPQELLSQVMEFLGLSLPIDWSTYPLTEKFLVGLEHALPPELDAHLNALYQRPTQQLAQFLQQEFNLSLPPEWTINSPTHIDGPQYEDDHLIEILAGDVVTAQEQVWVARRYDHNIILFNRRFYGLPLIPGTDTLDDINLHILDRIGQCLVADSLEALTQAIDDLQLRLVESNYQGYNIVSYRHRFYGLHLGLGNVTPEMLTSASSDDEMIVAGETLHDVFATIDTFRPQQIEANYGGYNLVGYKQRFYAVDPLLGFIDLHQLAADTLALYQDEDRILMAETLEALKTAVDALLQRSIVENYFDYRIIHFQRTYYALPPNVTHFQPQERALYPQAPTLEATREVIDRATLKVVERNYSGFNIVQYRSQYYALSVEIGAVDLPSLEAAALAEYKARGMLAVTNTHEAACAAIDLLTFKVINPDYYGYQIAHYSARLYVFSGQFDPEKHPSFVALADAYTYADRLTYQVLETDYIGFKIVHFRDKYYGLALELETIDLAQMQQIALETAQARQNIVIADSHEEVRRAIERMTLHLVETNYRDYNIVFFAGRFFALSLKLGEVDLKSTSDEILRNYQNTGQCYIGASALEVKSMIDRVHFLAAQEELIAIKSTRWFRAIDRLKRWRERMG